jgi:hypothetical protein
MPYSKEVPFSREITVLSMADDIDKILFVYVLSCTAITDKDF